MSLLTLVRLLPWRSALWANNDIFILTNTSQTLTISIVFLPALIYNPKLEGEVFFVFVFFLGCFLLQEMCTLVSCHCDYRLSRGGKVERRNLEREENKRLLNNDLSEPLCAALYVIPTVLCCRCWQPHFPGRKLGCRRLGQPPRSAQYWDLQVGVLVSCGCRNKWS